MSSYQPTGLKKIFHLTRRLLAKKWLSLIHPLQIGITGSQGKTNTSQILAKVLSRFGPTVVTDTNLDTIYNVPITSFKVRPWTRYLVWELGIDHPHEMNLHLEIAKPTIGIVTGISPVHTDAEHLGSLENLIKEKRKLIEALPKNGIAILNYDDENVRKMASCTKAKILFYGTDKKKCHVWVDPKSLKISLQGTSFQLISTSLNEFQRISTGLIGLHHIYTIMSAYLVVKTLLPKKIQAIDIFKKAVTGLRPLQGRMSVATGPMQTTILDDSLRANPQSVLAGLQTLSNINYKNGKKIAVLGVMGELANPQEEHEKTGRQIVDCPPDIVICLGDWRKYTYETAINSGFPEDKIYFAKDVFEAADILKKIIRKNDLIYLKGSFLRNLKRILQILDGKQVCCRADICPYEHCGYQDKILNSKS